MITATERARLRALLAGPHDESAGYHARDCYVCARIHAASANALPALLDTLDAAESRVRQVEADKDVLMEQGESIARERDALKLDLHEISREMIDATNRAAMLEEKVDELDFILRDVLHNLPDKPWDAYETLKSALTPPASGAA